MRWTATCATLIWLQCHAHAGGASVLYTVTDIGDLPGGANESQAYGLNNAGQVAGVSSMTDGWRAFVWQAGVMTDLGTLGGDYSYGLGINDAGQIVGESSPAGSLKHAFLWQSGVMADLGTLGGDNSTAYAINSSGQIVGQSATPTAPGRAFIWQGGVMTDLGTLGGPSSFAQAVNDSGQAAGAATAFAGDNSRPTLWDQDGTATDLGDLGVAAGVAWGINNNGQVVGNTAVGTSSHAFLWENSVMTDLGTLGGPFSTAYSITDDGQILGTSSLTSDTSFGHAFLWDSQHSMRDLNDLIDGASGWTLLDARQMNDAGQIVGIGTNPDGFQHGYLLTPVPEPSGAVLALKPA